MKTPIKENELKEFEKQVKNNIEAEQVYKDLLEVQRYFSDREQGKEYKKLEQNPRNKNILLVEYINSSEDEMKKQNIKPFHTSLCVSVYTPFDTLMVNTTLYNNYADIEKDIEQYKQDYNYKMILYYN